MSELETDAVGNVILRPVTGWVTAPAGEIAVILRLQYLQPESGKEVPRAIQFVLTAQQALQLSEILTKQAARLLGSKLPLGKAPN